jgi:hypothetical protein
VPAGAVEAASTIRAERAPSLAARVARAAREAALGVEGVAEVTAGPLSRWVTPDRNDPVRGVVVTALPGGAYELALYLVAEPVPLHALADRVRERARGAVTEAAPGLRLGPIAVAFEDLEGTFSAPREGGRPRRGRRAAPLAGEAAER